MRDITISKKSVRTFASQLLVGGSLSLLLGCQGELKLSEATPPTVTPHDMSMSSGPVIPAMLGFADIYKDLDKPPGLNCTNQVGACHGGATPTGKMMLTDMAAGDMAKLMSNYTEVLQRVNVGDPPNSLILLKMLAPAAGGTSHSGGNFFQDKSNNMYQVWLKWIELGAPFDPVPTMPGGGG